MLILITYDVNITSEGGQRRLNQLAKLCKDYGIRVQHSVFECEVDGAQWASLENKLMKVMDKEKDSLRFYFLGKKEKRRVKHIGAKVTLDMLNSPLIL